MLAEFAGSVIECYGARRGEAVTRLSFSVRDGLIARRLFSSQFFGSGREWICVHWHNLMDAEGDGQCSGGKRFQFFWKGPFECNELLQGRFEPPKRNVVDSRSCGSKGGCCDSRRGLCCTHFPCHEPELWTVIKPEPAVRCAVPGGATGSRSGAQSYTCELRSCHRCQDGLMLSPCPRSCRPRSAPGGAVGAPSLPSTRAWSFVLLRQEARQ